MKLGPLNCYFKIKEEKKKRETPTLFILIFHSGFNLFQIQVRTHFARPNWKKVFSRLCSKHQNAKIGEYFFHLEVSAASIFNIFSFDFLVVCFLFGLVILQSGVFYCGAPVLAKELNKLCYEYNQKGSTKFEFHKEHF